MNTAWIMLTIAGLLEVGWSIGLKYTDGFNFRTRPLTCGATLTAMVLSMYLLSLAVRTIPIGTGYAIWTGIGALGAATLGMILFKEPATAARIACVLLIVAGIIGLKLTSPTAIASETHMEPAPPISFFVGGYGEGVGLCTLDPATGALGNVTSVAPLKAASFITINPKLPALYAVSELSPGRVAAFAIDGRTLTPISNAASGGGGPCHVSVVANGTRVFAANYGSGAIAAYAVDGKGAIGEPVFLDQHEGKSVNEKRQEGPHAHSVVPEPGGRFAVSADLGTDELIVYRVDTPNVTRLGATKVAPGTGPRHIAFAKDGRFVYIVGEMSNALLTFSCDAAGNLQLLDTQSILPADFTGKSSAAEVSLHPNGRFLYASNRGHDSIAVFTLDEASGLPTFVTTVPSGGKEPRHFAIDPSGRFLITANQKSDVLVAFAIDQTTGVPKPTGSTAKAAAPSCIAFARP